MKKLAYLLILFISFSAFADTYEDISQAIREGDARQMASMFGSSIDLTLLNQEDIYSKAQAELMIKDFFLKNPPKAFTIVHKGSSKEGTLFAVGNLTSTNGKNFRVSFVLKANQGKHLVQELRFEKGE